MSGSPHLPGFKKNSRHQKRQSQVVGIEAEFWHFIFGIGLLLPFIFFLNNTCVLMTHNFRQRKKIKLLEVQICKFDLPHYGFIL